VIVNILMVGYGRETSWYIEQGSKLSKFFGCNCRILFVDNKNSGNTLVEHGIDIFELSKSNDYYEFSAYMTLLEKCSRFTDNKISESNIYLILNDTAFSHHAYPLWFYAISGKIKSVDDECIWGDMRVIKFKDRNKSYLASWFFLFNQQNFAVFKRAMETCILNAEKNNEMYLSDNLNDYATHLRVEERERLIAWLFSKSLLRGWYASCPFEGTSKETRLRKGLTIFMENRLSYTLTEAGCPMQDLKDRSFVAFIANKVDRMFNLLFRLYFALTKTYSSQCMLNKAVK